MPSPVPVLSCRNITKRFSKTGAPAVNQVSFELDKGDLLGLLGPSGCGKTTLLRLVAGFEAPDSARSDSARLDLDSSDSTHVAEGEIKLSGQVVYAQGQQRLWVPPERRQIGVVFQDYALFPHLSVLGNVEFGLKQLCRRGGLPKPQIHHLAFEALQLVGLTGMEKRYPHELSGGQQQRVALARALAPRPPLILLDEPFSNLDVQVRLRLRQDVRDILKNVGASGIFVTHDQEEALAIADKVAVMQAGRIEQLDTPEGIYQAPASRFIAEFVTQANFLPVVRGLQGWESELGPLDHLLGTVAKPENGSEQGSENGSFEMRLSNSLANSETNRGNLMIAQEDLEIVEDNKGPLFVKGRQFLGRLYQYSLLMPSGQVLQVRTFVEGTSSSTTRQPLAVGTPVRVKINREKVRFFPEGSEPVITMGAYREKSVMV